MNKFHCWAIYVSLAVLFILQIPRTSVMAGDQANAQSAPAPVRLGPASAINLVESNGVAVDLRAQGGRIAWSDRPTGRALSIGVVQFGKIFKPLVEENEEFKAQGATRREEYEVRHREATAKMEKIRREMEGMNPTSPEYRKVYEEYQMVYNEFEQWRQAKAKEQEALGLDRMVKAFQDFEAAIDVVAKRLEIDLVLQAIAPDDLPRDDFARASWNISNRFVLRYPEGLDITNEVMEELSIKPKD